MCALSWPVCVLITCTQGTELLVLFGGVTQGPSSPRPLGQLPLQQTTEQHQATNEVLVLTGDGDAWFRPNIQGEQPPARAFHSAGTCVCVRVRVRVCVYVR